MNKISGQNWVMVGNNQNQQNATVAYVFVCVKSMFSLQQKNYLRFNDFSTKLMH